MVICLIWGRVSRSFGNFSLNQHNPHNHPESVATVLNQGDWVKNSVIIGVGNPDNWWYQDYPPQDYPLVGNPEVGNPDIYHFPHFCHQNVASCIYALLSVIRQQMSAFDPFRGGVAQSGQCPFFTVFLSKGLKACLQKAEGPANPPQGTHNISSFSSWLHSLGTDGGLEGPRPYSAGWPNEHKGKPRAAFESRGSPIDVVFMNDIVL